MKKIVLLFCFSICVCIAYAQENTSKWFVGTSFNTVFRSFDSDFPNIYTYRSEPYVCKERELSIQPYIGRQLSKRIALGAVVQFSTFYRLYNPDPISIEEINIHENVDIIGDIVNGSLYKDRRELSYSLSAFFRYSIIQKEKIALDLVNSIGVRQEGHSLNKYVKEVSNNGVEEVVLRNISSEWDDSIIGISSLAFCYKFNSNWSIRLTKDLFLWDRTFNMDFSEDSKINFNGGSKVEFLNDWESFYLGLEYRF